jgi:hypothetical protein
MPRLAAAATAIAIGAAASLALVACGGSDAKLLPGNTAEEISENLDSVQQLVNRGECIDAQDAALQVSTEVEGLRGIDPELKEALQDGAARLNEVVANCQEKEATVEEETVPEPETTEEEPKKEKKPKKVEPEETQPEEEEKPPPEPPEPPGKAKGHEKGGPAEEEVPAEEGSSGGIGPGSEAGGGD